MAVQDLALAPSFRIGQTIATSLSIWVRKLPTFILLSIVSNIPLVVVGLMLFGGTFDIGAAIAAHSPFGEIAVIMLVTMACYQLLTAAITYAVIQQLRGQPASFVSCLTVALGRLVPAVLTGLIATILMMLGMLLLIVPGMILATMYWIVVPVCVAEKVSFMTCLSRSAELTKGARWRVFGLLVIIGVVQLCIQKIVGLIIQGLVIDASPAKSFAVAFSGLFLNQMIIATIVAAVAACGYYYLRVAKEGVDIDQIAAVFD